MQVGKGWVLGVRRGDVKFHSMLKRYKNWYNLGHVKSSIFAGRLMLTVNTSRVRMSYRFSLVAIT